MNVDKHRLTAQKYIIIFKSEEIINHLLITVYTIPKRSMNHPFNNHSDRTIRKN